MAGFAPGLASIAARPPTPPRENTAKASPTNGFRTNSTGHVLLDTPDESPTSSADYSRESTGKAQKRVGFTLLGTQYHRFSIGGHESDSDSPIRQLPRSRDCKSSKSILKACTNNSEDPMSSEMLAFDNTNLPAMLRSTTQHLASASSSSRLDAYSTLLACLGAYDEIPEVEELAEKMAEITGYIRRDVTANKEEDGSLDIQAATQALKLATVLLGTSSIAKKFPEDFCSFILERSISSLEDQACPKILVTHYMHLLERQKFSSKHMNPDRVNRLISALGSVTTWVKGNRVVGHRLMIYQRLLGQANQSMVSRVGSWIDHLISGMLSTIKDLRARAIAFGMDAAFQLGTASPVSQAYLELFNRTSADGTKVLDFLCSRLIEMVTSKEDGPHVPRIWSVMIMFLRSRRRQLESWEHIKAWLVVIQRCFNSGDGQTKWQANIAWNRLIFAINLDASTSISMAKMLRQPIISQLERKSSDKNYNTAKQNARSTYCTLLYYALRPTATHAQLDQYWDLYVCQILPTCFITSKNDVNHACNILSALFGGSGKIKVWEDNRINDGPINLEDLPCLDPKWIRLRTASILQVFDRLFDAADWQFSEDGDAPILLAWRSFTSALGNAGGKEVKVSMDAMNAVAHIINETKLLLERSNSSFAKTLSTDIKGKGDQSRVFEKIAILISEAVAKIGHIPFLERRLIRTSQDSFEAADTPSSRSSRDSGSLSSPVAHLLSVLLRNVPKMSDKATYTCALRTVLDISLQSATSRRSQLSILRNLGRLLITNGVYQEEASIIFWRLLAESTSSAMKQSQQNEIHNDSPQYPGHEFREAVKILELGLQFRSNSNESMWHDLHTSVLDSLRKDVGYDATALVIIEPLAVFISKDDNMCDDFVFAAAVLMLEAVQWPQSAQSVERVQRRLWGVTHLAPKVTTQDPFEKLYFMVDTLLSTSYASLEMLQPATVVKFISATTKMIASCPPECISITLSRLQKGLAPWIEDAKGILSPYPSSRFNTLYSEIKKLWMKVVNAIKHFAVFDTKLLFSIKELVVAGLRSRHKAVVNEFINLWNSTFGEEGTVEYPEDLRTVLRKLRPITDIRLPNFPESDGEVVFSPLHFVDSQDAAEVQPEPVRSSTLPTSAHSLQRFAESIKGVPLSPGLRKAPAIQGSPSSARRGVKTTPKARLRHDDSQIQFAAIESSPLQPEPIESQFLTGRQKEIRERQGREAAAMFPEIGSSPRNSSRSSDYILPKLVFKSPQNSITESAVNEHPSPTYLPDVLMNELLGSSPTPSSKRSSDRRSDDDPLSSPPFVSSHLQIDQLADAPLQVMAKAEEDASTHFVDESLPNVKEYPSGCGSIKAIEDVPSEYGDASELKATQLPVEAHPVSDLDVHMTVPPASPLSKPSAQPDDNQPSDITNSFRSEGSSHYSVEEDQINAQLITEMERASQTSTTQHETTQPAQGGIKKRKRTVEPPNMEKRSKRTSASLESQAIAEVPRTGQMVAECVMIDVRKVESSRPVLPQQIKRESSASPCILTSTEAINETPVHHSEVDRPLGQEQITPMTAKKSIGRPRGSRNSQNKREEAEKEESSALRKGTRVSERLSGGSTSSPHMSPAASQESNKGGQWLGFGKTPRRGMFRWIQRTNTELDEVNSPMPTASSINERNDEEMSDSSNMQNSQQDDMSGAKHRSEHQIASHNEDGDAAAHEGEGEAKVEGNGGIEREEEAASAQGILQTFRNMLDNIKRVTLGREEEREAVGILFECVKEVHEAGRRYG